MSFGNGFYEGKTTDGRQQDENNAWHAEANGVPLPTVNACMSSIGTEGRQQCADGDGSHLAELM